MKLEAIVKSDQAKLHDLELSYWRTPPDRAYDRKEILREMQKVARHSRQAVVRHIKKAQGSLF